MDNQQPRVSVIEIRVQRLSKAFYSRIEEASRVVPSGR
nr:MAG TPA: hypothetical protein [Caudoviricetes sp.]